MGRDSLKPLLTRHLATTKGWDRRSAAEGGCRRAGTVRLPMTTQGRRPTPSMSRLA